MHVPEHSYGGDFELERDGYRHDDYNHDAEYHAGTGMMHDVEHEFDRLFHEIEQHTEHGVEHHDIHYETLHKAEPDAHPHEGTDFRASPHAR